jgi:hypothetical protein
MCSLRFENNLLTVEDVRCASISKRTPLSKLSFAFVSLALPLLLLSLSALHAISRFRMQLALKGIWLPFAIALQVIRDPFASCRKEFDYRMQYFLFSRIFWILHVVANPFWQFAKRNLKIFGAETKGASNPFK